MGWWKSKVAHQMLSCFCIFRNITPSWMAPLALLLLFSSYKLAGFIFFRLILTSLTVLLSTVLFMWKHKAVPDDELTQGNGFCLSSAISEENSVGIASIPMHKNENAEEQDSDDASSAPSLDHKLLSEYECRQEVLFLSTSEDYKVDHTPECSDGTISDEDSLIEIALPSGHFVGESNSKYNNCSLQQKKALFNQQSLMEFLAEFNEMNEEENMIEIDIAMGSIKCSRFEIEA